MRANEKFVRQSERLAVLTPVGKCVDKTGR